MALFLTSPEARTPHSSTAVPKISVISAVIMLYGATLAAHEIPPPQIEQAVVPASAVPGATRAIPVIRVVFDERTFFAPGSAVPQPGADAILQVIADNMHHDVPDVRVTLLGHADIATTQIYTHVDGARLVALVNARHPLARS